MSKWSNNLLLFLNTSVVIVYFVFMYKKFTLLFTFFGFHLLKINVRMKIWGTIFMNDIDILLVKESIFDNNNERASLLRDELKKKKLF